MASLLLALIYICFISLGLPDSLLGSAWPVLHEQIHVPVSYAGVISMAICVCTILSSLFSDKLLRKLGAGKVTAFSIALTALGLGGFSVSDSFWELILYSVPYGLGAGGVDAILNNYVEQGKKVFVISCYNRGYWTAIKDGVRYINLPNLWFADGTVNEDYTMLRFRVQDGNVSYEAVNIK